MKKLFALILALIMVLSLAACGQEETPVEPDEPVVDEPVVDDPTEEIPDTGFRG